MIAFAVFFLFSFYFDQTTMKLISELEVHVVINYRAVTERGLVFSESTPEEFKEKKRKKKLRPTAFSAGRYML